MRRVLLVLAMLALSLPARAQPVPCPQAFAGGQPPVLLNPRLGAGTRLLCYHAFAVLHSAVTRTALWSAEHLTADRVVAASQLPREGRFHAETRLPPAERANLSDYVRSGLDRGHLSPSGDMATPESQQDSFSLANVVPQAPQLNRKLWAAIEEAVRKLARQDDDLYVVTGAVFQGAELGQLRGRVLVPSAIYKAVYDPTRGQAAAYLCPNVDDAQCQDVGLAQLAQQASVNPFPGVAVATAPLTLPAPELRRRRYQSERRSRERISP